MMNILYSIKKLLELVQDPPTHIHIDLCRDKKSGHSLPHSLKTSRFQFDISFEILTLPYRLLAIMTRPLSSRIYSCALTQSISILRQDFLFETLKRIDFV